MEPAGWLICLAIIAVATMGQLGGSMLAVRMTGINWVSEALTAAMIEVDFLDLSLVTSEYGRTIHPCKGCVSTAMPLCHWPCTCYPNHALNQTNDWMAEIYERWVVAHGVIILAPTYWYQSPSP